MDKNVFCRDDAMRAGLKKYFTGIPCVNGHISERYVRGYECIACLNGSNAGYYEPSKRGVGRPITRDIPIEERIKIAAYYREYRERQKLLPGYEEKRKAYNAYMKEYQRARKRARKRAQLDKSCED